MASASRNAPLVVILMIMLPICSELAQGGAGAGGAGGAAGAAGAASAAGAGGSAAGARAAGAARGGVGSSLDGGSGVQPVAPNGVAPNAGEGTVKSNVRGGALTPGGSPPTAGVADGHTIIVNPSPITPVPLGRALGDGSPSANLEVPGGSLPTSGLNRSNVRGNSALDNASGINSVSRGISGGDVGQSRAGDSRAAGNISGVVPAARVPAAGGAAPGGNASASAGNTGATLTQTSPPPAIGQSVPAAPTAVQGISSQVFSQTGLSKPGEDGVSTKIVAAKPCTSAARETDGTTTCVGLPRKK
jgi:hypothetical protein